MLSEAYLLVNLYKQVPHRAGLVSVLYFTFALLVVHELKILSCILSAVLESENLLCLRVESIEWRLVIGLAVDSVWLQSGQDGRHTRKNKNHRAGVENWGFFGERA